MSDFKPTVKYSHNDGSAAVLPPDVRGVAWKILFKIQEHVVDIDHDAGYTELQVFPNEGYTADEAKAILIVAVYAALVDFQDLIAINSLQGHLQKVSGLIKFSGVNSQFFEKYLKIYLAYAVEWRINKAVADINTSFNLELLKKLRQEVSLAKRSIEFIPLTTFTITPWEKRRRMMACQSAIDLLDEQIQLAKQLNETIRGIIEEARLEAEDLLKSVRENPYRIKLEFNYSMETIANLGAECVELLKTIDGTDLLEKVYDAIALAPPPTAPTK